MTEQVAKTGFHIYGQSIAFAIGGGLYWIIAAALVGPAEMGKAAYVVSLAALASTAAALGLDSAVLKMQPRDRDAMYTATALYLALSAPATAATAYAAWQSLGSPGAVAAAVLTLAWLSNVYTSAVVASFNAQRLPLYAAASIAARFAVTFAALGAGWAAVAYGYAAGSALYLALTAATATALWGRPRRLGGFREIVKAGLSAWPSQLVAAALMGGGTALAFSKAHEAAGAYYLAYTVATVAVGLPAAIARAAIPYFAATGSPAERVATVTAYVGAPFVAATVATPSQILALIRQDYAVGGPDLAALAPALWLNAVASVHLNKKYADGRYVAYALAYAAFGATLAFAAMYIGYGPAALAAAAVMYALSGAPPRHLALLATVTPAPLLGAVLPWPAAVAAAFLLSLTAAGALVGEEERRVVAELAPKHLKPIAKRLTWTA